MEYVLIWFILKGSTGGYIEPQKVTPMDMSCGLDGAVTGVQLNAEFNPTELRWPDPGFANMHCRVSISARVQTLPPGLYEIATTEVTKLVPFGERAQPYIGIDPHTTDEWRRTDSNLPVVPRRPLSFVVGPPPQ